MRLIMGNIKTSSPFGILYHPGTIKCKSSFTVSRVLKPINLTASLRLCKGENLEIFQTFEWTSFELLGICNG